MFTPTAHRGQAPLEIAVTVDCSNLGCLGPSSRLRCRCRERDVAALPWYFLGKEAGAPRPLTALQRALVSRLDGSPSVMAGIMEAIDQRLSPLEMVPAWHFLWWTLVAFLRQPRVLGDILASAARAAPMVREQRARRRLLVATEVVAESGKGLLWR